MLVGESTWSQLHSKARLFQLKNEVSIPIVAPEHLVAMKLRACTSPTRLRSAVELCILNEFDPQYDAAFAELVIQFGNESLLKKLINEISERNTL